MQSLQGSTHSLQSLSSTSSNTSSDSSRGTNFCHEQVYSLSLNSLSPALDPIPSLAESIVKQLPNLGSKEIGTYPDCQHRIQLSPDAILVTVKTRPIPYAVREKVADAIHLLNQQGIWELAHKGDWVHPLVTPAKSDGTVWITTDLSRLNKFIIPIFSHHWTS